MYIPFFQLFIRRNFCNNLTFLLRYHDTDNKKILNNCVIKYEKVTTFFHDQFLDTLTDILSRLLRLSSARSISLINSKKCAQKLCELALAKRSGSEKASFASFLIRNCSPLYYTPYWLICSCILLHNNCGRDKILQ